MGSRRNIPWCPFRGDGALCMGSGCAVSVRVDGGWVCGVAHSDGQRRIVQAEPTARERELMGRRAEADGLITPPCPDPIPFYEPGDSELYEHECTSF